MPGLRLIGLLGCFLLVSACDVRTFTIVGDGGASRDGPVFIDLAGCQPIPEQCNGLDDDCDCPGDTNEDGLVCGIGDEGVDEDDPDDPNDDLPGIGIDCGLAVGTCELGTTVCTPTPGCVQRGDCVTCAGDNPPVNELCDGEDNDCDGETDNGFNFCRDIANCGACGVSCELPEEFHGTYTCNACETPDPCTIAERPDEGVCKLAACKEGWADCDLNPCNGCECPCGTERPGPEICDGEDNDCDGLVDAADPSMLPGPICRQSGECAGTVAVCVTDPRCAECGGQPDDQTCWVCDYGPTVELEPGDSCRPAGVELRCDDLDGNCNALTDESFPLKNQPCDNGLIGGCKVVGQYVCNPAEDNTECNVEGDPGPPPSNELCNGVDDNCNDITDENADDAGSGTLGVRDALVRVTHGAVDVYMYRYEASRPGATDTEFGDFDHRACSTANVLPWGSVTYDEAAAACSAAGMRLCSREEWEAACFGATGDTGGPDYPYGGGYNAATCNGAELNPTCGTGDDCAVPTGSLAGCQSSDQVYDLSGNLKEWTSDFVSDPGPPPVQGYRPRGGAFDNIEEALSCDFTFTVLPETLFRHENLGFRCCCDPGPGCPPP